MLKRSNAGTGTIGDVQHPGSAVQPLLRLLQEEQRERLHLREFQKAWNAGRFFLAQKASTAAAVQPASASVGWELPAQARHASAGSTPGRAASRGRPPPHAASSVAVQLLQHQHAGSPWHVHMPRVPLGTLAPNSTSSQGRWSDGRIIVVRGGCGGGGGVG